MNSMAIKTTGIDHIHFNVRDLKRMLGTLNQLFETDATPVGHLKPLGIYNSTVKLVGADAGQPFLDLFQSASDSSGVAKVIEARGPSVSFISFRVEDIEAAAEHATKRGLREVSRFGFRGMKQVQYDTLDALGFEGQLEEIKRRLRAGETVDGMKYVEL